MKVAFIIGVENQFPMFMTLADLMAKNFPNVEIEFVVVDNCELKDVQQNMKYTLSVRIIDKEIWKTFKLNNDLFFAAKDIVAKVAADLYFVPYEYNFYNFLTFFAQESGAKVIHVQHAMWGSGKFYSSFRKKTGLIDNRSVSTAQANSKLTLRSFLGRLKRRIKGQNDQASNSEPLPQELVKFREMLANLNEDELDYRLTADCFLVPNQHYKDQVAQERPQYPLDRVIISGVLKSFDKHKYTRQDLADKYDLDPEKKWAVYLYSNFEQYPGRYTVKLNTFEALDDFAKTLKKENSSVVPVVIVHPGSKEHLPKIKEHLNGFGKVIVLHDEHFDFYREAELIVGAKSTALMEACLSGNPVIRQLYVLEGIYDQEQFNYDAIYMTATRTGFKRKLSVLLSNKENHYKINRQAIVKDDFFLPLQERNLVELFETLMTLN